MEIKSYDSQVVEEIYEELIQKQYPKIKKEYFLTKLFEAWEKDTKNAKNHMRSIRKNELIDKDTQIENIWESGEYHWLIKQQNSLSERDKKLISDLKDLLKEFIPNIESLHLSAEKMLALLVICRCRNYIGKPCKKPVNAIDRTEIENQIKEKLETDNLAIIYGPVLSGKKTTVKNVIFKMGYCMVYINWGEKKEHEKIEFDNLKVDAEKILEQKNSGIKLYNGQNIHTIVNKHLSPKTVIVIDRFTGNLEDVQELLNIRNSNVKIAILTTDNTIKRVVKDVICMELPTAAELKKIFLAVSGIVSTDNAELNELIKKVSEKGNGQAFYIDLLARYCRMVRNSVFEDLQKFVKDKDSVEDVQEFSWQSFLPDYEIAISTTDGKMKFDINDVMIIELPTAEELNPIFISVSGVGNLNKEEKKHINKICNEANGQVYYVYLLARYYKDQAEDNAIQALRIFAADDVENMPVSKIRSSLLNSNLTLVNHLSRIYNNFLSDSEKGVLQVLSCGKRIWPIEFIENRCLNSEGTIDALEKAGWIDRVGDGIYVKIPLTVAIGIQSARDKKVVKEYLANFIRKLLEDIRGECDFGMNMYCTADVLYNIQNYLVEWVSKDNDKDKLHLLREFVISTIKFWLEINYPGMAKELLSQQVENIIGDSETVDLYQACIDLRYGDLEKLEEYEEKYLKKYVEEGFQNLSPEMKVSLIYLYKVMLDNFFLVIIGNQEKIDTSSEYWCRMIRLMRIFYTRGEEYIRLCEMCYKEIPKQIYQLRKRYWVQLYIYLKSYLSIIYYYNMEDAARKLDAILGYYNMEDIVKELNDIIGIVQTNNGSSDVKLEYLNCILDIRYMLYRINYRIESKEGWYDCRAWDIGLSSKIPGLFNQRYGVTPMIEMKAKLTRDRVGY